HNSSTVTMNATDGGNTLAGTMTGSSSFNSLTFNGAGGSWSFGSNSATIADNFSISAGGVTASSNTLTIGGNFLRTGSYTHNSGTVVFNDSGQTSTLTYSGATTFNNFTCSTASKTLEFDNDAQTNVAGTFTIDGSACGTKVNLRSDSDGNRFELDVTGGSPSIDYADVKDSEAITSLSATNSKSSGNVVNWTIDGGVCGGVTISGNAYENESATDWTGCDDSTANISLVVNGSLQQTALCDSATGAYSFYTVTTAVNNPVSVFMNATDKGVAATVAADGSSDITINPIKNLVTLATEGAVTSIDNTDLDHCDSVSPGDCSNVPYSVTTSNLVTESGIKLKINSSDTYDPGGTVTTNSTGGVLHVDDNATAYLDTATNSIGAGVTVDGGGTLNIQQATNITGSLTTAGASPTITYTNTPTLTLTGDAGTAIGGGSSETISFYNLLISSGTYTMDSATTTASDLTVNGTMDGSSNVTVNGTVAGTGIINMSGGTFEQRVATAENFGTTSGANNWTFSTLMFSNSSGASGYTVSTQSGGSGSITASTLLQIGKSGDSQTTTLAAANRTWTLSGTTGTPFDIIGSSILTGGTSTFSFTGNNTGGNTTVQTTSGASYYTFLTINNASETFDAEGSIITRVLTVTNGTLDMGSNDLTVGATAVPDSGSISVAGTLTQSSGTTTVRTSAAGSATIGGAGTLTFYNLTIAPSVNGSTITLGSAASQSLTVSNDFNLGNDINTVTVNANTSDPDLDINGNLSIGASASFTASSDGNFYIAKNFTNNGTFTHSSGTVTMDSSNDSTFNGSGTPALTLNNFIVSTGGKNLIFTQSKVLRFEGLVTITGDPGDKISINSSTSTQWEIDHQGTENITYTNVQYSGCESGTTEVTLDSTNSDLGNNGSCWIFLEPEVDTRVRGGVKIKGDTRIR
ncbi:beta strand repeat-containing protein, partial [Patescibacteria group bacterium]